MKLETACSYLAAWVTIVGARSEKAPTSPDALPLAAIPSTKNKGYRERVLADIDQDGLLFARETEDRALFNTRESFLDRSRAPIQVVISKGTVCVRKFFPLKKGTNYTLVNLLAVHFISELAALKRLQATGLAPRVIRVNPLRRSIDMEFVAGHNLRQIIGSVAPVLNLDMRRDPLLRAMKGDQRMEREFALCVEVLSQEIREEVVAAYRRARTLGVIPRDIHPANVILGKNSGKPYLVDFELALIRFRKAHKGQATKDDWLAHKLRVRI
jgi:tRNA A-37 threonylcarbamoyl transferase component Bud32